MEWAQQRKIVYALGFALVIILLAAYPVYSLVKQNPTCSDGKQNGTETGVDCGGICSRICTAEVKAPRIVWAEAFSIGENTYDLGAYVENANLNAGIKNLRYTFTVYDNGGQVLAEKNGTADLVPASTELFFETGVTFTGTPYRTEVVLNPVDLSRWTKASIAVSDVLTKNQNLSNTDTKPRFDAVLVNNDPIENVNDLTLGAIIYDTNRNPVAISRTHVDTILKNGEMKIFFTWPNRFTKYAKGETCTVESPVDATSTISIQVPCPQEKFITEIVVTPAAIFAQE